MNTLTDVHCHILPGVDDGAADLEESKQMLRMAYEEGIRTMIATPHYQAGQSKPSAPSELIALIQEEAYKIGNDLQIHTGNEIYYSDGSLEALRSKEALTLANTRYVLVEFSPACEYSLLYQGLKRLQLAGYMPILAHMERYHCLKQVVCLTELRELGIYMQMNADRLIGGFLDGEAARCKKLAAEGYIDLIGTDAHGSKCRAPQIKAAIKALHKKCSNAQIHKILYENPDKLLQNKYI